MADDDLLTMEEVARRTGVTLKTVYRWIEAGELPVSRLGKRVYRIFDRDFIDFIYSKQINKSSNMKTEGSNSLVKKV